MHNKKEKAGKNQMLHAVENHFRNTSSILIIAIFTLLSSLACKGQVDQEKNTQIKSNVSIETSDSSKDTTEISGSNLLVHDKRDTVKINQYKDGKKNGLWRTFYANGQLKAEGNYKLGLKEGMHREWEKNGILALEGFYVKGKANGLMKWFHEKGHLAGKGNMKNNIREGKWIICDVQDNGFCIEAYFKDGKKGGTWKIYHEHAKDKLWKEQTWKEDKVVSEKCWDEKGKAIECN